MLQPLFGFASADPLRFRHAVGHTGLYFIEDKDLEFKEVGEMIPEYKQPGLHSLHSRNEIDSERGTTLEQEGAATVGQCSARLGAYGERQNGDVRNSIEPF